MVISILNEDRQNYRTLLLGRSPTNFPDGTTNSLNDLYLTATRINKSHTIQRRHINTFSQASRIGQDASVVALQHLQPVDLLFAVSSLHSP